MAIGKTEADRVAAAGIDRQLDRGLAALPDALTLLADEPRFLELGRDVGDALHRQADMPRELGPGDRPMAAHRLEHGAAVDGPRLLEIGALQSVGPFRHPIRLLENSPS